MKLGVWDCRALLLAFAQERARYSYEDWYWETILEYAQEGKKAAQEFRKKDEGPS